MKKKRILIITQEMSPYIEMSSMSRITRYLAPHLLQNKAEIRLLMPRFGTINEKRHRLHEVVRLSGMNIIINNDDMPLIIKVASLPDAKMQVYFLDNDELFSRKAVFHDTSNKFFKDNDLRMVFFCKSALETVKKLGWQPDIIHCHGWMTSLIPLYIRKVYTNEPVFSSAKIVYSVYENSFAEKFNSDFNARARIDSILTESDLQDYMKGSFVDINIGAMKASDAVIIGNDNVDPALKKFTSKIKNKAVLDYKNESDYLGAYTTFYKGLMNGN